MYPYDWFCDPGSQMWLCSMESRMLNVKCTFKNAGSLLALMVPWRTFNINGTFQLHKRYSVKTFLHIIKTLVLLRMVLQWHCCEKCSCKYFFFLSLIAMCNCRTVRPCKAFFFFHRPSHSCFSKNLSLFNYRDASVPQLYTAPSLSVRSWHTHRHTWPFYPYMSNKKQREHLKNLTSEPRE